MELTPTRHTYIVKTDQICSKNILFCLLASTALTAGCATSRNEVKVSGSDMASANFPVTKSTVIPIRAVTDERLFEETPSDPSIPSLGHEGTSQASADTKARAIARKRNTFGKALGDVLLEKRQTISMVVRDNLVTALSQAGYRTTTNATEAVASPMIIDAHIKQFWAISLNANIVTNLEVTGAASPTTVNVHAEDSAQFATEGAWIEIVDKTLKDYRAQVNARFVNLP
ncbi:MAG TPA: hypothetical protein VEP71_04280 [Gallionella sp.]|nr:hypothetical protein [Gallionella sp.]